MADTQSILQLGIEAARSGDKAEARELFRLVTREDANNVQGWLWLAGVAEDRDEKRVALERVLQLDPSSELARKGLAALGGASAASAVTAAPTVVPPAPSPSPVSSFQPTTAPTGPTSDQDVADAFDSIDDYAAAPVSNRSRVYEQPDQVGGYVPPDFGDDDYDLADYQDRPRAVNPAPDRDRVVVIEDEEPRRRGFGAWLPALAILLLMAGVLSWLLWRSFGNSDSNVAVDPNASASAGAIVGDPGVTGSVAPDASAVDGSSAATDLLASPSAVVDPAASAAVGTEGSAAAGGEVSPAAAPSVDAGAPVVVPPTDGGVASAPAEASAAAPPPVEASAVAPPPVEASAAAPPPVAPGDVATANPAIVPNTQVLRAGDLEYTFTSFANSATGSYGGATPARGRYLIVLMAVRNVGGAPIQVPDGFFVVKDAQGRVYDFNRAASVDYINRFGGIGPRGAGDYAADAQLPPNGQLGSMPFLFDVAADATDLVAFSRDNTAQGFLVRQNAR